jgi:dephospho-CoA kinase
MMVTIGLTGSIGSGKTTVARLLEEHGAIVINADTVGHDVYRPNTEGWRRVTGAFGMEIVAADGNIDRKKLGAKVFANPTALAELNRIVHPLIAEEIRRRIDMQRSQGAIQPIVVEAAVLIEANWAPLVDQIWVITASRKAMVERVCAERGLSASEVASRLDAQMDDAARRRLADVVIENTGTLDELRARVAAAWERATAEN